MSFDLLLQTIQAIAVVVGVIFGLVQLRQIRKQREAQAGVELLHVLQSPDTAETMLRLHALPNDLSGEEIKQGLGKDFGSVLALMAYFESLGPLVARGHVPLEMYAEFYRGPTVMVWSKMGGYVVEQRAAGWPMLYEWLQWLAEQMEGRGGAADVPAFVRFRKWRSEKDFNRLAGL
jgi:hypothetical protein